MLKPCKLKLVGNSLLGPSKYALFLSVSKVKRPPIERIRNVRKEENHIPIERHLTLNFPDVVLPHVSKCNIFSQYIAVDIKRNSISFFVLYWKHIKIWSSYSYQLGTY